MSKIETIIKLLREEAGYTALSKLKDPYRVLITTIISQRLRDETTEKVSKLFFSKYKTPKDVAKAKIKDLETILKSSGFYRNKARNIKSASKIIVGRYGGKVPSRFEDLIKLPGVGRKTANCVLVYAYGKSAIPVDTHVHRVANRIGLVNTKTPEQTEKELKKVIPKKFWREINSLFIIHGKSVCKPVRPKCDKCPIRRYCKYAKDNKRHNN